LPVDKSGRVYVVRISTLIACGECESVDALRCAPMTMSRSWAVRGLAISAMNSCRTRSRVTSASASRRRRVAGRLGHRSRFGLALNRPIVAYRGGGLPAQRSSAGCSHDISAAVAMPVMMQTISTIVLTSLPCWGGCGVTENAEGLGSRRPMPAPRISHSTTGRKRRRRRCSTGWGRPGNHHGHR
jgi:hypothetical protein